MSDPQRCFESELFLPNLNYSRGFEETVVESSFAPNVDQWIGENQDLSIVYRRSLDVLRVVYSVADSFLRTKLYEDLIDGKLPLPINIRKLAEKCNFTIEKKDFSELMRERNDRTYLPVAQMQMRSQLVNGVDSKIAGTICVADTLGETSIRFAIAHELAHFVLRKYNPNGLNYLHEACAGMYPLCDGDELLSDLFAYALLLPYESFLDIKEQYENDNSRWPIDFSEWIIFLRDKTQMPEYQVLLAYQTIKQYTVARRLEEARNKPVQWLNNIIKYLFALDFSKSEIKRILLLSDAKWSSEVKSVQSRLSEIIDINVDTIRECHIKGLSLEIEDISNSISESREDSEYGIDKWKIVILKKLFDLGFSDNELHTIMEYIGVHSTDTSWFCMENV